jgi:hypothetical protein
MVFGDVSRSKPEEALAERGINLVCGVVPKRNGGSTAFNRLVGCDGASIEAAARTSSCGRLEGRQNNRAFDLH